MQNRYKTTAALALAGVATVGLGTFAAVGVAAQETTDNKDTFIQSLAEKLGVDADKVEIAFDAVREEEHAKMEAEMDAKIAEAVKDGKLTERQAQILNAMQDIREEKRDSGDRPERIEFNEESSEDERKAQMEEVRAEHEQEMIDDLNDKGLNVTAEELDELHETMKDLELGVRKFVRRGPGMGDHFEMRLQ
jgi:hypothetical protein